MNADGLGFDAARLFWQPFACKLRRRYECSVAAVAGFKTVANVLVAGRVAAAGFAVEAICVMAANCVTMTHCGLAGDS